MRCVYICMPVMAGVSAALQSAILARLWPWLWLQQRSSGAQQVAPTAALFRQQGWRPHRQVILCHAPAVTSVTLAWSLMLAQDSQAHMAVLATVGSMAPQLSQHIVCDHAGMLGVEMVVHVFGDATHVP